MSAGELDELMHSLIGAGADGGHGALRLPLQQSGADGQLGALHGRHGCRQVGGGARHDDLARAEGYRRAALHELGADVERARASVLPDSPARTPEINSSILMKKSLNYLKFKIFFQ